MKRQEYDREVALLLKESTQIEQLSVIEFDTAKFLIREEGRLYEIMVDEAVSFEDKELARKALDGILHKMEFEQRNLHKDDARMVYIKDRIKVLTMISEHGLIQD